MTRGIELTAQIFTSARTFKDCDEKKNISFFSLILISSQANGVTPFSTLDRSIDYSKCGKNEIVIKSLRNAYAIKDNANGTIWLDPRFVDDQNKCIPFTYAQAKLFETSLQTCLSNETSIKLPTKNEFQALISYPLRHGYGGKLNSLLGLAKDKTIYSGLQNIGFKGESRGPYWTSTKTQYLKGRIYAFHLDTGDEQNISETDSACLYFIIEPN